MPKTVSATDAKNNFGGLLEDVADLGRIDIVRHGRLVAVVLSPRAFEASAHPALNRPAAHWGKTHMIPPVLARAARMLSEPSSFDEE